MIAAPKISPNICQNPTSKNNFLPKMSG